MKNLLLASTSTLYGEKHLEYLLDDLKIFFKEVNELCFIPFARPGAISWDHYTRHVAQSFAKIGITVKGIHEYLDPKKALLTAQGIFTGGGNTFVLVKELYDQQLMDTLRLAMENGVPYLGCSAGSNIAGMTMHTTNDMPIVMPKSFETTAAVPFNINAHYMDPIEGLKHNGESRIDRIAEFQHFHKIPVVGIPEGDYIRVIGNKISLVGPHKAKLFMPDQKPIDTDKLPF